MDSEKPIFSENQTELLVFAGVNIKTLICLAMTSPNTLLQDGNVLYEAVKCTPYILERLTNRVFSIYRLALTLIYVNG
jgi:hypothetical protein